jgi:broad specificity phosphatase PhoE
MKSVVILCRHGNTFTKGDKAVMVGAKEDLPLTEEGLRQAADVGWALRSIASRITRVISGPLRRTLVFADTVKQSSGASAPISIDERLTELDYGQWSGLSNDEIVALSGEDALRQWQDRGVRPRRVKFLPSAETVARELTSLLKELENQPGVSVVVSSNGRLRELRRLIDSGADGTLGDGKVSTGRSCVVVFSESGWKIVLWNCDPKGLETSLAQIKWPEV